MQVSRWALFYSLFSLSLFYKAQVLCEPVSHVIFRTWKLTSSAKVEGSQMRTRGHPRWVVSLPIGFVCCLCKDWIFRICIIYCRIRKPWRWRTPQRSWIHPYTVCGLWPQLLSPPLVESMNLPRWHVLFPWLFMNSVSQNHFVHWFYPRVHIQINLYSLLHSKTIVISSLIVVFLKLRIPESLYCLWKVMRGRWLSKPI